MIGRNILRLATLAALILWFGPAFAKTAGAPPFSHSDHIGREPKGKCTDCHDASTATATVKKERCDFCHDGESVSPTYSYPRRARRLSVSLPHATHARVEDCETCHTRMKTGRDVAGAPIMPPGQCLSCHEKKKVTGLERNCTKCHTRLSMPQERPRHFLLRSPHDKHRRESCDTCHLEAGDRHGALLGTASHCFDCHEERKGKAVLPACETCHDGAATLIPGDRRLQADFPHQRHAGQGACSDCHSVKKGPKGSHGAAKGFPAGCFSCHEEKAARVPTERCEGCHDGGRRLEEPASHVAGSWSQRHGEASRWAEGVHGEGCELCHRADACTTCHQQKAPRSHNGLWRLRSHGRVAAFDRDDCKACHESGQCVSCHRSTRPLNHQGIWSTVHGVAAGDRENASCLTCHRSTFCVACHSGQTP